MTFVKRKFFIFPDITCLPIRNRWPSSSNASTGTCRAKPCWPWTLSGKNNLLEVPVGQSEVIFEFHTFRFHDYVSAAKNIDLVVF